MYVAIFYYYILLSQAIAYNGVTKNTNDYTLNNPSCSSRLNYNKSKQEYHTLSDFRILKIL